MDIAAVGDFSGDGRADIFWRDSSSGTNAIWVMNGSSVASGAYLPSIMNMGIVGPR